MKVLENDWGEILNEEFDKPYYLKLRSHLKEEYQNETIYPSMDEIFSALHHTAYQNTKVVILGQDPYHNWGQAHGFSFSVKPGVKIPPSLRNIYKELQTDVNVVAPDHGYLMSWAKQGVLLLNNVLTVRAGEAHSHQGIGWERFTDRIIERLNHRDRPVVFILWGRHAQVKAGSVDRNKHKVITSSHPSPLAAHRGFFGSRPFSQANQFLVSIDEEPIDWSIPHQTNLP